MLPIIGEVVDLVEKGVDNVQEQVETIVEEVPKITRRKEVFNIDNNDLITNEFKKDITTKLLK